MGRQINGLCGAILLLMAGQASALTTWTLSTSGAVNGVGDDTTVTATSTGWANTGTGTDPDQLLQVQNLSMYTGGLGMTNLDACGTSPCDSYEGSSPEHAIDNNGRYEMVLLSFNARVNLTGVTFGWTGFSDAGADSDYSILAYTPLAAPSNLAGQTWDALQSGWTAIGNYANAPRNTLLGTGTGVYSSSWLIGAYNPLAAGATSGLVAGNDYIKLKSVVGTVRTSETSVPEPGSLALIVLALFSMLYMRGRRQA